MMTAHDYDAWYRTPRGAWIGETEFRLLSDLLRPERGASALDVGCGTGYFTRRFAAEAGLRMVGLDRSASSLDFARAHAASGEEYCVGTAERLPFADRSFDYTVSVTALCFVEDVRRALQEILRVTRVRFAIGLLNRRSLLYREKGQGGGTGAYRGAYWHTPDETRALFDGLAVDGLTLRSAVFIPSANAAARLAECLIPRRVLGGAFIVAAGARSPARRG